MAKWSLQDAKNRFSEVVTAARKAPQTVTKHGKPAVVIVDADHYDRLTKKTKTKQKNLIEQLLAMPKDDGDFERFEPELRDIEF
jgi:antitoxin Phd